MPRMRSPQELLRDSRRELLSRSPRSSSPLERSEPIALMERGRTCGLFFRHPQQPPPPQQPFPTATALAARRHPHAAIPAATAAPRSNHSLLQPPPPQRPPHLSQRRVADEPWRRMFAARTARTPPSAAPSPARYRPPRQPHPPRPPHEARIHPSRCGCPTASPGKNRTVCVLFSTNARNKPSPWQCLPEMYAFRDRNGKILALCVHFQVQSGGFGYMA